MSRKVILVHGIRKLPWGKNPMKPLYEELQALGVSVEVVDYGYILVPLTNSRAKDKVLEQAEDGCILVCYSNGLYAGAQACEDGLEPGVLVGISGALDAGWEFPDWVGRVVNYYNPADRILTKAKWWAGLANWMPWRWKDDRDHGWGDMGKVGYKGSSMNVQDIRIKPKDVGHSWHSHKGLVERIAQNIKGMVERG